MTKLRVLAMLLASTCTGQAGAAVSGFYDSAAKITAILEAPRLADVLRQAPIRSVEEAHLQPDGSSVWIIRSQHCDVEVTLVATPPKGVGRSEWRVSEVSECR